MTRPSQELQRISPTVNKWHKWWPNREAFVTWASKVKCHDVMNNPLAVWMTDFPTVRKVAELFGEGCAKAFICTVLNNAIGGKKSQLSDAQLKECYLDFYTLMKPYTVSEVLMFFSLLRTGYFKTYGDSTQETCRAFRFDFMTYRAQMIDRVADIRREQRYAEWERKKATPEQIAAMIVQGKIKNLIIVKQFQDEQI